MGEHDKCNSCVNSDRITILQSRIDRMEVKLDGVIKLVEKLEGLVGKVTFIMIGALFTAVVNLVILVLTK
jgi:tetrahydromethanopterin S-methyltransferase subunit G